MNAVSDIIARPILPIELIVVLGGLAIALIALAATRRLKGAWLRLISAAALMIALLDPALLNENRRPLADVVALVVDESASQDIEDRRPAALAAASEIESAIERLSAENEGQAPIELRRVRVSGDGADGTRLVSALGEALADVAPDRVAGAIVVSDGAVSDGERRPTALSLGEDRPPAPVHVLLTGREDEFDRRLVVETAPGFGLVGEEVTVKLRVEQTGDGPSKLGLPRIRVLVDGVAAASGFARVDRSAEFKVKLEHPGLTVVELRLDVVGGELTDRNNVAAFTVNGVRDRLRVLLVSGEPHPGERTWRNLLKSDPSVDLVHFTILRPPRKQAMASVTELALIPFPTRELFEEKLDEFDLIVFDRYRRWGILRDDYIANISRYVRRGGAVLVSTGPAFAETDSMYRTPLRDVLPAAPTTDVVEGAFRPDVTALGFRHPVTRGLPEAVGPNGRPVWGRWFRLVEVAALSGDVVMEGAGERPLLILDRVGDGRVAMMASDNVWLWARGYDGGGPQAELLRRLAHWLMKEPELEEEALTATPAEGGFEIERRSLAEGPKSVLSVGPDDAETRIDLAPAGDGLWRATALTDTLGLHRIYDAPDSEISRDGAQRKPLSAIAVVGPPSPKEFSDPVSTEERLTDLVEASGGSFRRLSTDGAPDLRRIRPGRATNGSGWIGLARREAYAVEGVSLSPLAPSWLMFAIAGLFAVAAWRIEGR